MMSRYAPIILAFLCVCSGVREVRVAHREGLYLREKATTQSRSLAKIPFETMLPMLESGTFPQIYDCNSGEKWIRVRYSGQEGWVLAGFVSRPSERFYFRTAFGCPVRLAGDPQNACAEFAAQMIDLANAKKIPGDYIRVNQETEPTYFEYPTLCSISIYTAHVGGGRSHPTETGTLTYTLVVAKDPASAAGVARRPPFNSVPFVRHGRAIGAVEREPGSDARMHAPEADLLLKKAVEKYGAP